MKELDLAIFPSISKDDWVQLAENQLKGEDPIQKLKWQNAAGFDLAGYYDRDDLKDLEYLKDFFSDRKHDWKLFEEIKVENPAEANNHVLKALLGGCDGVVLHLADPADLDTALEDVNTEICNVSIRSDKTVTTQGLNGFFEMPEGNCVADYEAVNPVLQCTSLLTKMDGHSHVSRKAFPDFFLEIATTRALTYLLETNGHLNIHLHSRVGTHESDEHQWFLNTTSGLASILGGSHSLEMTTATGDSRITRNTGNLIREECGITTFRDQCGGSYYIEVLTHKIIQAVKQNLS